MSGNVLCEGCAALSRLCLAKRGPDGYPMTVTRNGVTHALHVSFDDEIPLCDSVSMSTRREADRRHPVSELADRPETPPGLPQESADATGRTVDTPIAPRANGSGFQANQSRVWKPDELYAIQRLAHELSSAATEALSTMAARRMLGVLSTRLDAVVAAVSGVRPELLAAAHRYATAYQEWEAADQESAEANAAYIRCIGLAPRDVTDRLSSATARESAAIAEHDAALEELKAAARAGR